MEDRMPLAIALAWISFWQIIMGFIGYPSVVWPLHGGEFVVANLIFWSSTLFVLASVIGAWCEQRWAYYCIYVVMLLTAAAGYSTWQNRGLFSLATFKELSLFLADGMALHYVNEETRR